MSTPILTKVTSVGSHDSSSCTPSVPNATPASEVHDHGAVDSAMPVDLTAVTNILAPIQEELNDSAEEAMYPSPPINTPEALSPAPSSIVRQQQKRVRGLSAIGDRLAQLKLDMKLPASDVDGASSHRSLGPSGADELESASVGDVLSDGSQSGELVPIMLGPPAPNPLIEEYLAFNIDDPSATALAPQHPATLVGDSASSTKTYNENESMTSSDSKGGVTEHDTWAEEVEDHLVHAFQRLEQLAKDEHVINPDKSVEYYYTTRLQRLLGNSKRLVPVKIKIKVTKKVTNLAE